MRNAGAIDGAIVRLLAAGCWRLVVERRSGRRYPPARLQEGHLPHGIDHWLGERRNDKAKKPLSNY